MNGQRARRQFRIIVPALVRLALVAVAALLIGVFFGRVAALAAALAAVLLLLGVHLAYLSALGHWLEAPRLDTLPNGVGTWTEVFTRLYKMRRASDANELRLIDNEQRFRRTISALPEGIVLIDSSLQIEWCNPVAEQHLGISLRSDHGLRLTNLVRDPAFVAYVTSGSFGEPLVLRPMNHPGRVLALTVIDFEPARSIVISRDVTQTERVDAMRRDFVANVSHELRTPLTVVNGFLETLLEAEPPLDATRMRHLRLMQEQASRMARLVEDLLLLSRLESTETPAAEETVDVPRLVRELEMEARALSHGNHVIAIEVEPARVRGSRDELRSAFGNLVSNAVHYTPEGGRIALRWRTAADGVRFEVEDTGIGVAAEDLPRLTERFYRVDKGRSRATGGTGLGLAIVKHVLLRHQGRLDIHSQVGRGSTFAAWLPVTRLLEADDKDRKAA